MEKVKVREKIGHFFWGEPGHPALRRGYRIKNHLRALVPHARCDLRETRIKGLRPFSEIDAFLCARAVNGMAIGASLGTKDRPAFPGIAGFEEKGFFRPLRLGPDIGKRIHHLRSFEIGPPLSDAHHPGHHPQAVVPHCLAQEDRRNIPGKLIEPGRALSAPARDRVTGDATFLVEEPLSRVGISRLIKKSEEIEIGGDFGKILSGQRKACDPRLLHPRDHGGSMVPYLRRQVQLCPAETDPAQVRPRLPSLAADRMALHAPFADQQLAPTGRVFRQHLSNSG